MRPKEENSSNPASNLLLTDLKTSSLWLTDWLVVLYVKPYWLLSPL